LNTGELDERMDTKTITDKVERKKAKRTARKKADAAKPKGKRTTPRGSNKQKVKKLARGVSKR
jgi:hypothetical protein